MKIHHIVIPGRSALAAPGTSADATSRSKKGCGARVSVNLDSRRSGATWGGALLAAWLGATGATAAAADRYVNPTHPAASDVGFGPATQPYRTITFAMSQLQAGDRLVIAEGVYRETLRFPPRSTWVAPVKTVIEGKGRVLIKGSDVVTGWSSLGDGRYVKSWPKETAQVFINGVALQQIGGNLFGVVPDAYMWPGRKAGNQDSMPPNSFYYDKAGGNLFLRTSLPSLTGQTVEVSTRMFSMFGENLSGVTVRNLHFQHGNTSPFNRSGLVTMIGQQIWLDLIKMTEADAVGIELVGNDNKLTDSVANYNGQVGVKARGKRVQLARNETSYNNTRGFNKWWEAGGAKFTGLGGLQDSLVTRHKAIGNFGDGIWFDWKNKSNRIENSTASYNTGFGIHYEASGGGLITNNVVVGNGQRGIHLPHSSDSVIAYNLIAGNKLEGIVIVDEGVRDPTGSFSLKPVNNRVFGNVVAWNRGALVLPADRATNVSNSNVFIGAATLTTMRQGWSGKLLDLLNWMAQTNQDRASRYSNSATDPALLLGAQSSGGDAYVDWFKQARTTLEAVVVDPAWSKLVPGAPRDAYAGPML